MSWHEQDVPLARGRHCPILQGVLCEVGGGKLTVTGTDNEITVRTFLDVEVTDDGSTVIPAKLAADAVRKLPSGCRDHDVGRRPRSRSRATARGSTFERCRSTTTRRSPMPTRRMPSRSTAAELTHALAQVGVAASATMPVRRSRVSVRSERGGAAAGRDGLVSACRQGRAERGHRPGRSSCRIGRCGNCRARSDPVR